VEENLAPYGDAMEKRRLRVLKWLGTIPAVGTCGFLPTGMFYSYRETHEQKYNLGDDLN
jgi:hypothetical protein